MTNLLKVPYFSSRGLECGQTCVAMMIKYFFPEFTPNFDEFNTIIHHTQGKYTFPLQNSILLNHYGIKTKCFSSDDCPTTQEEPGIFKRWFGKEYEHVKKYIDEDTYNWAVVESRTLNLFEKKSTSMEEVLDLVIQGNLVSPVLDLTTLQGKTGDYEGHFVLITGFNHDEVIVHDPDDGPNISYSLEVFKRALSHPAIEDDFIVAYGIR